MVQYQVFNRVEISETSPVKAEKAHSFHEDATSALLAVIALKGEVRVRSIHDDPEAPDGDGKVRTEHTPHTYDRQQFKNKQIAKTRPAWAKKLVDWAIPWWGLLEYGHSHGEAIDVGRLADFDPTPAVTPQPNVAAAPRVSATAAPILGES